MKKEAGDGEAYCFDHVLDGFVTALGIPVERLSGQAVVYVQQHSLKDLSTSQPCLSSVHQSPLWTGCVLASTSIAAY